MPVRETYLLHLYRSRAVNGWQWAARLERLPGGESVRFRDPEALLAHLQALVRAGARSDPSPDPPPDPSPDTTTEAAGPPTSTQEGGTNHGG